MAGNAGSGQTVLVTGASAGIGVDLAECFAKNGYDLIITARSEAALGEVGDRLAKTYGVKVAIASGDLGVIGAGAKLATDIAQRGLSVDVLVNNAGFGHAGGFADQPIEPQLGMIDLNIRALTELTHIYWKGMLAKKRGGVLNVASTAAFQPGPLMAIYYASKAYVLSFSEAIWFELRGRARVTCLCPGPVPTGFAARASKRGNLVLMKFSRTSADFVAARGWDRFQRGQRVVVPGLLNEISAMFAPLTPKPLVLWLAAKISR